ncbi:MAG: aspartate--tRNA(Asn) ligase [Candidatus Yonathbacteria bacterium RIFCSPHIGHO2_01_FULL_51_10]|uniref:Aspartate--tRNA ligase n=1 Tax=Candidatus Yonathbacteria bacterium RIFCSPHIGHO2_01_FULL_51_10 TaxID=1802723 RepID=A0A1G2S8V2_9BACT|nr:MAG: aspartate--tRNA(Asn) ligase [Candidatus Yonathbacteria bacterium RIFCSPHIGHO2_01_FULL_51_10]
MERTYINDLPGKIGGEVSIAGWIDVRRDHGKLIFIDLRDKSGLVQMVALPNNAEAHAAAQTVRPEWVVEIRGKVNKRPEKMVNADLPTGAIEIEVLEIKVLARAEELPFDKDSELNLDTYLDNLPLTLRRQEVQAVFRVQARIINAFREFLIGEGFTEAQVPKLTGSDAEGGAAVFPVEYFGHTAYLATSPQLYKQILVGVFERVFATGNMYRAEKHSTTRHLNEYTSLDLEMGFIKDHTDIMALEQRFLTYLSEVLAADCTHEFKLFKAEIPTVGEKIPTWKLREAQEIIKKEFGEDCTKEPDLEPQHERWLSEYAKKEFGSDFAFITHYPVKKRPFYTYEDEADPGFTKSFDLLFRGVEITTGGQRIHEYDKLVENIKAWGLKPEKFSYYLQAFKYGMPPEGGLAIGLERLTAKLLGIENVKQATLFPRDLNRIDTLLSKPDSN